MLPERLAHGGDAARALIGAVARRRRLQHGAWALGAAAAGATLLLLVARMAGAPSAAVYAGAAAIGIAAAALVLWRTAPLRTTPAAAAAIEAVQPACRNVLITAEELGRHPDRAASGIAARVFADADRLARDVRASEVVQMRTAYAAVAGALALALAWSPPARSAVEHAVARVGGADAPRAHAGSVRFTINPPRYAQMPSVTLTDPERIEALEGSRVRVDAPAAARVRFGDQPATDIVARSSGYFAIEHTDGTAALVPLTVTPDRAPIVRIEAPAKDLLLPDGTRTIPVSIRASDDQALSRLELRYTKVSGSGEQFEFVEGTLPVRLVRTSDREWRADGALALPAMTLGPGDSLVYRAVASDRRPGQAGLASSDTFFVEIAGPGQIALEGVAMPPELERYAMSQQMIVLKLERLQAKAASLPKDVLAEESESIAAEQRTVRANFIFLLGGHVEDEEEEAEQSHEIQEGRLENTARKDINAAISQMTRVGQGLAALNTAAALPPARAAVESLQRAFGRSRYLLRSLATRSRLDPARRLTGRLDGAADWRRTAPDAEPRAGDDVRQLLGEVLATADAAAAGGAVPHPRRVALAEAALAIDPSSSIWQTFARRLGAAADPASLQSIAADLAPLALQGMAEPSPLERGGSALIRAYKGER
jgi:hypothetical protein